MKMFKDIKTVTLELTNRCNLRCRICNIWHERKKYDLSEDNIAKFIEPLPKKISIALTGGEPFLHPRFPGVFRYMFRLFLKKKTAGINIATNLNSGSIVDFLASNSRFLPAFSVSVSLDGIQRTHDIQRGKMGAFSATIENILAVRRLGCPVSIKFVITSINYRDFGKVYALSKKMGCPFYPKFFETAANYYHRSGKYPRLGISAKALKELLPQIHAAERSEDAVNNGSLSYFALRNLRIHAQGTGISTVIKRCLTPRHSLFVTCRGDIYSCLYQKRISVLFDWPDIDIPAFTGIKERSFDGFCPGCLSYHGSLREFNFR